MPVTSRMFSAPWSFGVVASGKSTTPRAVARIVVVRVDRELRRVAVDAAVGQVGVAELANAWSRIESIREVMFSVLATVKSHAM